MKEMELLEATMQPSTLKPSDELLQRPLVNPPHEFMSELSDVPLQECLQEVLQVTNNDVSVDALEKCLQQSSLSSSFQSVFEEAMVVSILEPFHDPSQQLLHVVQNKMSLEPEHLEVPLQESSINPSPELAQKPLQDVCANDMSKHSDKLSEVMSQDVCDKPMLDIVLETVDDSMKKVLQVQEN